MIEAARAHCYVCDKVASMCLCARVPRVTHRTGVTIVQDPREARHPFGTARIARLGLSKLSVHVVGRDGPRVALPEGAALLFPEPGAPLLGELSPGERPRHLVVVDGRWGQVARLRRAHPELGRLPTVALAPTEPSRYRIRREPHAQAVSTLEAIVAALRILEPETRGLDRLLAAFDAMIDDQLERRGAHPHSPRHRHTPRIPKPLPEALAGGTDAVSLLYTELHQPAGQSERFLLRVTAARLADSLAVDALVESPLPPSPQRVRNMELGARTLAEAIPLAAVPSLLRRVIRASDTVVAWNQHPEPMLRALGFTQPFVSAKHHFANQTGGRLGRLSEVVARLGAPPIAPRAFGRAGRELAQLAFVVSRMRAGDAFARYAESAEA